MNRKKIVVVGAGLGGLSTAALLAKDDFQVTVLEKNDTPGGRARAFCESGFRFDMGPSWYLMPEVFQRFFQEFGKAPEDFYQLQRLDPSYRMVFGREDVVDVSADLEQNRRLFGELERDGEEKFSQFLSQSQVLYDLSMNEFVYKEFRNLLDYFSPKVMNAKVSPRVFGSMDSYVGRYFKSDKARKLLEYSIVFLGGNPKKTPAMYSMLSHVDFNLGVWYPQGGMHSLVQALVDLCRELGVEMHFGCEVTGINVQRGRVSSVRTNGGDHEADIAVVNADYAHAETELLPRQYQTFPKSYWEKKTIAPSAFILYLGLNRKLKNLEHHNIVVAHDWKEHFQAIFDAPSWPDQPSYYVCMPSKTDPTVAPKAHENLFVLVPVASGLEDPDEQRDAYSEKILRDLEAIIGEEIQPHIIVKRIFSQRDFASDYNAYRGTALGLAHTLGQSALFRPSHRSKAVRELFYTGQYTHPGIGVPMTIISSTITRNIVSGQHVR